MERNDAPPIRELFIEELAEVTGGAEPLKGILDELRQRLVTTTACGEEIPVPWPFC